MENICVIIWKGTDINNYKRGSIDISIYIMIVIVYEEI